MKVVSFKSEGKLGHKKLEMQEVSIRGIQQTKLERISEKYHFYSFSLVG